MIELYVFVGSALTVFALAALVSFICFSGYTLRDIPNLDGQESLTAGLVALGPFLVWLWPVAAALVIFGAPALGIYLLVKSVREWKA